MTQRQRECLHITVPPRCHPLVRPLFQAMRDQNTSYGDIERRAGVSWWTLRRWRRGQAPYVSHLEAALNVVGLELTVQSREAE